MEHLWDLIGWDMNRGLLAQTVDVLRTALDVAWHRLSHATIYLLIERMPRRMEACIAATANTYTFPIPFDTEVINVKLFRNNANDFLLVIQPRYP
ncbi:hypothetical protein TNCV_1988352 [Trichonephila clavipes]|nr:hypothetical protein TNCV_1988352 [Trichonephila clavipes]